MAILDLSAMALRLTTIKTQDKALFYEHISNLVEGGVTILEALSSFSDKTDNLRLKQEVLMITEFVRSGDPLSTALKKLPRIFDRGEIAVIEAGEQSGTLQRSLVSLAIELREMQDIKNKIKGAMTYPIMVFVVLIVAVMGVMLYIVPRLMPLFESTGATLPLVTKMLIVCSTFVQNWFLALFLLGATVIVFFKVYFSSYEGARARDQFLLRFPVVGTLLRNYLMVRITGMFSLLLSSGIPIVRTLRLTGEASENVVSEEILEDVAKRVEQGDRIAESIEGADPENTIFPRDFVQLVAAGERTSTINKVAERSSAQYKREVDMSVQMLVKFVEPLAIIFASVFVLWFAIAIFAAIIQITQSVGG